MKVAFELSENDLKYFKRCMKEVRERSRNTPEEKIIAASRDIIRRMDEAAAPDFVIERVHKLERLIDMLEDEEWALTGRDRERVVRGMAYFAEPEDIIPDRVPVLGFLDDAIMVELVVIELIHEVEAYEDFCNFRTMREARFGTGEDPATRNEWLVARRKQLHARIRRRRARRRQRAGNGGHSPISLW